MISREALICYVLVTFVSNVQAFTSFITCITGNTNQKCTSRPSQHHRFAAAVIADEFSSPSTADQQHFCDVLVLGSGPAACAISSLLGRQNLTVILADLNADRPWVPNYGAWKNEWQSILDRYKTLGIKIDGGNVGGGVDREWSSTDCFFGGSFNKPDDERLRLDREYVRLDRFAVKDSFVNEGTFQVIKANHQSTAIGLNIYSPSGSLVHHADGSTVQLVAEDGQTSMVRCKIVVDCTGHESTLVLKEAREPYRPPGFQIAYGILAEIATDNGKSPLGRIGPYDSNAMTLFDYRTDHLSDPVKGAAAPTFMYSMPLQDNLVFFEETSLVARPAISFQECKDRCLERLKFHGITVIKTLEEEFCYIPMGGALPKKDQRVIALGGSAAMVHPATGYHVCRCFAGAADVAAAIGKELQQPHSTSNIDRVAAAAYHSLWSPSNQRQRNFAVFGGEFLMKQNVKGLRGFFDGFFRLPLSQWAGFLAGWPGLPYNDQHETWSGRILYGLNFIACLPPSVALDMLWCIVVYSLKEGTPLLQSVTPFFGEPSSYEYMVNSDRVGDVAAKREAKRMIQASTVTEQVPVAFDEPPLSKADTLGNRDFLAKLVEVESEVESFQ